MITGFPGSRDRQWTGALQSCLRRIPQFANGIASVDNAIMIFGGDGFNPWINTLQ